MNRTQVVFLGPTLPLEEAQVLLPGALYLPPAGQGDVLDVVRRLHPHSIGLIDGVFTQRLAVFHKELLDALEQGVWVLGSSSMGALRAAECEPFGMIGVGEVFRRYRADEITDDDEVAVAHTDPSEGPVRLLSIPFVNLRATLDSAVRAGIVDVGTADRLGAAQKARHFPDRTMSSLTADARALGLDDAIVGALGEIFRTGLVDLKADDARMLLTRLAELPDGPLPEERRPRLERSHVYRAMVDRDAIVEHDGDRIHREDLLAHVALEHRDFNELRDRAWEREAIFGMATILGFVATPEAVAAEEHEFRRARGLQDDDAYEELRTTAQLTDSEWHDIFERLAVMRMMRNWVRVRFNMRRTVMPVIGELVRRGEFEHWLADATLASFLVKQVGTTRLSSSFDEQLQELARAGWNPQGDVGRWMEESGLGPWYTLRDAVERTVTARRRRLELEALLDVDVDVDSTL